MSATSTCSSTYSEKKSRWKTCGDLTPHTDLFRPKLSASSPPITRSRRIFENAGDDIDVVAILNGSHVDPNFFYVSGYKSGLFEGNLLFLFSDGHVEVLTNRLEEGAAREKKEFEVHVERSSDPAERRKTMSSILKGCARVGINFQGVSHRDYEELEKTLRTKELVDVSDALRKSRMVKDPDELDAISKASKIISSVVDRVPEMAKEGMTEKELKGEVDYVIVKEGADSPSFDSIVAFGENSAIPHHAAGERRLRRGDNVLIDAGARYNLYCSDITRTFFFGHAERAQNEVYAKVLEAQASGLDAIRAGVRGSAIHGIAARVIDESKFRGKFTHGLGHSIGLEVHDGPALSPRNRDRLEENMVLTVEPGIYQLGKGGVRIEDDVVVTKDSCRQLTTSTKELLVI
ncbi:MAG: Xaa-Pro peptidase family protein [Thaumarchaeota archaeon]|nr:Xaa-Pro peptidase family protein [Nitrososphaerota archaeon]